MKINLKAISATLLLFLLVFSTSCSIEQPRFERLLGTVCFVNLYEKGKEKHYEEIFSRLRQIDDEFNITWPQSDLYRVNAFADEKSVVVCDDVFTVLQESIRVSEATAGAFDVSVGPLVSLWQINTDSPHVAEPAEIESILPLVDYKNIILNPAEKSVRFAKKGMRIDLGGIAKGFAADEIVKICKKYKIRRAVIDLGGNVYVYGKKKDSSLWTVGVKNPEHPDAAPLVKMTLPEISVVTSGNYERFFEENAKRYHHILSPQDGYPVDNELYSVTVLSPNSMLADALTTAFFVLGREESLKILPSVAQKFGTSVDAIFIEKNHAVHYSSAFPYDSVLLYDEWMNVLSE